MTPRLHLHEHLQEHRDDLLLLLVLAAALITALADLLGWFRIGGLLLGR
jgi:hypothetical protein